ncbi:MAG: hypothetical protein WCY32_15320 [Burkholderiaceae bacterium]
MSDAATVTADRVPPYTPKGEESWLDTIVNVHEDDGGLHASLPAASGSRSYESMRSFVDTPNRFRIRLANDEGRRSLASYLVSKRYGWRGYQVGPAKANPNQVTLVASDEDRALATLSVGFDSPAGLLVDKLYPDEVNALRTDGARLCEFTRLAVETGRHSREVLAMLFHIAYIYARRINHHTDLLIEVNPRHVRFYETALGFEQFGPERICPRVHAPAVLLKLDLAHCEAELAALGGHRKMSNRIRSLYPLGFSPEEETGICARLMRLG